MFIIILRTILFLCVIPMVTGALIYKRFRLTDWVFGFITVFAAISYVAYINLAFPMKWGVCYVLMALVLGVFIYLLRKGNEGIVEEDDSLMKMIRKEGMSKETKILLFLTATIFIRQMIRVVFYKYNIDGDDDRYIKMLVSYARPEEMPNVANAPYLTIYKYSYTTYYQVMAAFVKLTGVHPLVIAKTIIPVVFVILSYLVVWKWIGFLYSNNEKNVLSKKCLFLFMYALLIEFGSYSYYALSRRVLIFTWNSKSFFYIILCPYILLEFSKRFIETKENDRELILLIVVSATTTLMTGAFACIIYALFGITVAFKTKKIEELIKPMTYCMIPVVIILLSMLVKRG